MDIKEQSIRSEKTWKNSYAFWNGIIQKNNFKTGAEIGVAYGGHVVAMLKDTQIEKLHCVDPYKHFRNYNDPINVSQSEFDQMSKFARKRASVFGKRAQFIRRSSAEAAIMIKDSSLDFVYLDANHTFEEVSGDLGFWFTKVKDGGVIGGHDYGHVNFPGVKDAVDSFFGRFGLLVESDKSSVWWIQKNPIAISFIIPAYNCQGTIAKAVQSILDTNIAPRDEIIIVNDCSTDKTAKVIDKISKKHQQISVYHHKVNRGGGAARNTAVINSKNQLIFCLDADNVLRKDSIEHLKQFLIKTGVHNVCFEKIAFFRKTTQKVSHVWTFNNEKYGLKEYLASGQVPGASGNYLYTKKSWQHSGGYPEFAGAMDTWGFGLRLAANGFVTKPLRKTSYYHGLADDSYWMRDFRAKNSSLVALQLLIPYLNFLADRDIDYLFSKENRTRWFENLSKRPLVVKKQGEDSTIGAKAIRYLRNKIKI